MKIHFAPLREAILVAFEHAEIELHEESREMMRVASTDEKVWQYFLGATSRMQPTLAATLHAAATIRGPSALPADEPLRWDVRAGALLGAISTAYRSWPRPRGPSCLSWWRRPSTSCYPSSRHHRSTLARVADPLRSKQDSDIKFN
ncbi:hypothetical protein I553_5118 [Mycobacterium xenopi 4042]|uniref:Uncharacterized protein n=1 Tax=Mycobacterium xenopi 4042 TaxID=1299334 RepID=X7ZVG5_MYCXE|nr:hypothetical protein I553_5118 [Mycobacterium xenopi 4042]